MNHSRPSLLKWGLVGPTLALLIAMNVFPLCYNIALSFTDANIESSQWSSVGMRNYARVFANDAYSQALRTTGLFVLAAVTVELLLGFALALALRADFRFKKPLLIVLLIPMMLPPAVMGVYWHLILDGNYGVLNQCLAGLDHALAALGLPPLLGQPQWRTDPDLKLLSILLIDIWMWTPFMMLIALAGLSAIPRYIYEAAEIDRASRWTVFRRITLPMCAPLLVLAVLLRATDALKQFDLVMAVTGPNDAATQTLSALLYQVMIKGAKVGQGSAYAVVLLVLVIAGATLVTRYIDFIQRRQGRSQP